MIEVEVVPTESFTADVLVRGELDSCEVVDGALQRQKGTDRDTLPDDEFIVSLISRTSGPCSGETVPFEEVVPISSYSSGSHTVTVNGVVETFTFPSGEQRTVEASIKNVDVVLRESNPVQVVAEVTGLQGGCTTFIDISQRREANTFFVTVLVSAPILPGEPPCPPTEYPFTEQVVLETQNLAPGTYEVDVNGVAESFALP